ncbi:MAG: hypothetical protein LBK99_13560 [Opitutaceae bacterium]|jgi:hypothetical protein|nr:hypothetical protein [Opitutaceae bacterium]
MKIISTTPLHPSGKTSGTYVAPGLALKLALGLTLLAGSAAVPASVSAQSAIPTPTARYTFDDTTPGAVLAPNTAITDTSGNNNNGSIKQRPVTVTTGGISGNALTNLSTGIWAGKHIYQAAQVALDTKNASPLNNGDVTLSIWAKNPGTVTTQDRFVLFGTGLIGENDSRSLQVWLSQPDAQGHRTLNVTVQNWYNGFSTWSSAPLTWKANAWYNIALTWKKIPGTVHGQINVFLTKRNETLGPPLLTLTSNDPTGTNTAGGTRNDGTGVANGPWIYFGGQSRQPNAGNHSGGGWGTAGIIDEATVWIGAALTKEQLAANFALHANTASDAPEPPPLPRPSNSPSPDSPSAPTAGTTSPSTPRKATPSSPSQAFNSSGPPPSPPTAARSAP